jgi:hypothetical protein
LYNYDIRNHWGGDKFINELSNSWEEWDFLYLDSIGCLGEPLAWWRKKHLRLTHFMVSNSRIVVALSSLELGKNLNIVNVYGPYEETIML